MKWMWVLVLLLPGALAASIDIKYELGSQTHITYTFSDVGESLNITLPQDAIVITPQTTNRLFTVTQDQIIEFTSEEYARRGFFTVDFSDIQADIDEIRLYLPESATLTRSLESENPSVTPRPRDVFSDGRRIILLWQQEDIEPARAIVVEYEEQPSFQYSLIFLALILVGAGMYLVAGKSRSSKNYTKNLFEDEKLLVNILLDNSNEMWQNSLTKESGLSKVKVSRKLNNLEKKGIIQKIPHGNTNKIQLIEEQ
jgi:uncharacterized membrane protein